MKIENLEEHIGERLWFVLEHAADGSGDWYQTYFSSPKEALDMYAVVINHMDPADYSVSVCYGTVNDDGQIDSWDPIREYCDGYDHLSFASVLDRFRDEIVYRIEKAEREAMENAGAYEIQLYIDDTGEIMSEQFVRPGRRIKSKQFWHVYTASAWGFDWRDGVDPEETDVTEDDVIDICMDNFDADEIIDRIIADQEKIEEEQEKDLILSLTC